MSKNKVTYEKQVEIASLSYEVFVKVAYLYLCGYR